MRLSRPLGLCWHPEQHLEYIHGFCARTWFQHYHVARLDLEPVGVESEGWVLVRESIHFVIIIQAFRLEVSVSSYLFLWLLPKVSIIAIGVNPEELGVKWIEGNRQMKKGMEVPGC